MLLLKSCVQPFQTSVCFLTLLLSFLSVASTHGQASLLRFEGHVGGVSGDSTLAGDSNLYMGQPFNFTVLIDPSRVGTYVDTSGNVQPINAFSDPAYPGFYENAFHVEFIGGNRIWNPGLAGYGYGTANYASYTTPIVSILTDPMDTNSGTLVTNAPWGVLIMSGSSSDNLLTHFWNLEIGKDAETLSAANPSNWNVGEVFSAVNRASFDGRFSTVGGMVTLIEISPVPEPSIHSLSVILVGLIGMRRILKQIPGSLMATEPP